MVLMMESSQMETFSAILVLCAGNSPVTGEFPTQRPVTRSFDVFFDLRLNKPLSKKSPGWWFETTSCSLWRHCNVDSAWPTAPYFFLGGIITITCTVLALKKDRAYKSILCFSKYIQFEKRSVAEFIASRVLFVHWDTSNDCTVRYRNSWHRADKQIIL